MVYSLRIYKQRFKSDIIVKVAVIGATGLVGDVFLKILAERGFPVTELYLYSSNRSAGVNLIFRDSEYRVMELCRRNLKPVDLALFSAGAATAREWAGIFAETGALVVDNSSAFRRDAQIPLIVPEVNAEAAFKHRGIIANPNCSTIGMVTVLQPLHAEFGLKSVIVTSFQSVSGAGRLALDEYRAQISGQSGETRVFSRKIAGNVIPQIGDFDDEGSTSEETKFSEESQKIMNIPDLTVTATAVRVPVETGHSLSVTASFANIPDLPTARQVLANSPGIRYLSIPDEYPTPLDCVGRDDVYIGRLRSIPGFAKALSLWIVSDNLRKGAALNAIQIAELVLLSNAAKK